MIADFYQLLHILFLIGRRKYMVFLSHLFFSQSGLVKSAGGGSADIASDQRIEAVHGKCFLCQQDVAPRFLLQLPKTGQILNYLFFIHHITRRGYIFPHRQPP